MPDIHAGQMAECWVEDEIEKHVPHVEITLAVPRHQAAGGVGDVRKTEVWWPETGVEPAACTVVDHADVVRALRNVKIMGDTGDFPWFNVTQLPDSQHLVANQGGVPRVLAWDLGALKVDELPNQEVWLPLSSIHRITLPPIPKERYY